MAEKREFIKKYQKEIEKMILNSVDFKDKYIRAQVMTFEDLVACGSKAVAREQGKLRTEGKEYIVQDGDVIEFMHS